MSPSPDSLSPSAPADSNRPAPERDVTRAELIAYTLPDATNGLVNTAMTSLANPILVTTLGVSPGHVGLILMLRGFWDALIDPVTGFVSDNFRSRFGRRRPFIFIGGILMALTLAFAWQFPTDKGETTMLIYFGLGLLLFATAQSIFSVPFGALGLELSPSYHGRTRVQMAKTLAGRISSFAGPYLFPFCLLGIFSGAMHGVRWLAVILAVLMVVATTIAALKTKERTQITAAPKENFFHALASTVRCPEFLRITFVYSALLFSLGAFGVFQYFLVIYYVFAGNVAKGAAYSALVETFANVLVLVAIPVINWACRRFQKHNALRIALGIMIVGSCMQLVLINPRYPWLMFISPFFYSLGIVATFMILGTLMADAVDMDELRTGQRREGLFSAAASFMMKTMLAIATGVSGFLIEATGFVQKLGGDQAPGVFDHMRWMFAAKGVLLLLCLVVLHKYPLTEARVVEIQAELRRRRATA